MLQAPERSAGVGASLALPRAVRISLPQQVRTALEELILTGTLREGDQIVEYLVARQMGISQGPVREALRTLEQYGLVVTIPHRGTYVRSVTRSDAEERYTLGAELEAFAVRLALPRLTAADFPHLERLIDEMAAAGQEAQERAQAQQQQLTTPDPALARSVELNVAFHRYLVERAGHKLLLKSWLATNPLNWRFITYTRLVDPDPVEQAERHRTLLDAYRTRDVARASAAVREHILGAAAQLLPNIPEDENER